MYNALIGLLHEPDEKYIPSIEDRAKGRKSELSLEYDNVRHGLPSGVIDWKEHTAERKLLLKHYRNHGYDTWPWGQLSLRFRKHVAKFRACLDFWEQFSKARVMCKDEIYYRCLDEGHSFTEFVKKMRATCFRAFTAETDTDVEEEYYSDTYDGYNSIIHERYLIHWDDKDQVDDVKYAFMPTGTSRRKEFRKLLDQFWEDFRLDQVDFSTDFDMIGAIKNTKMYDPITKKTSLMRDFWKDDIDVDHPYYAKRVVVPTTPGSTRDTGVGDPSTILKVKQLNSLARCISEVVPYCANCDAVTANARLKRVLRRNSFLHLDFKKYGLTFPRELMNELISKIGESSGIDTSHLIIKTFTIEIDGKAYYTNRGTVLGWLDSINAICVAVILHALAKTLKFDFVLFNDDVEISKMVRDKDVKETLELLRFAVISEVDYYDIPISINKTFGSKCSVFLERYAYYDQYGIDMYKEQLTVDAYAKSCVTIFKWQAKFFFASAEQWTKSKYAEDRCIDTCPIEFRKDEKTLPLWAGGWYIRRKNGLDLSLVESDDLGIRLGIEISKLQFPKYSVKPVKVSKNDSISEHVEKMVWNAGSDSLCAITKGWDIPQIRELNEEVEYVRACAVTKCDIFGGREEFAEAVLHAVQKAAGEDPGG